MGRLFRSILQGRVNIQFFRFIKAGRTERPGNSLLNLVAQAGIERCVIYAWDMEMIGYCDILGIPLLYLNLGQHQILSNGRLCKSELGDYRVPVDESRIVRIPHCHCGAVSRRAET